MSGSEVSLFPFILHLWALLGCGDPLLAPPTVGLIADTGTGTYASTLQPPEEPYVAVRWYVGPDLGTFVPCASESAGEVVQNEGYTLSLPRPGGEQLVPPLWAEGPSWRYALATFVLTEGAAEGQSSANDPLAGVWGIDDLHVALVVEGDPAAVAQELGIPVERKPPLRPGLQWLTIRQDPLLTNGWDGLLQAGDPKFGLKGSKSLFFWPLESGAFFHVVRLVAGLGPGGITFEACP